MNHIIVSRLNFTDRALLNKYLAITKKVLIPALKSQTQKNFNWVLLTNANDEEYLKQELDFPFTAVYGGTGFSEYVFKNKPNIQTRHDCDDWMSPKYVEKIQSVYSNNINEFNSFLIHSQPVKLMYHTNVESQLSPYHDKRCSMFLSLCQREVKHHIFEKKHGSMYEIANKVFDIGAGYNKWVIHGNNISVTARPQNQRFKG